MDGFLLQCEIVPKERGFKNILGHSSTLLNESYLKGQGGSVYLLSLALLIIFMCRNIPQSLHQEPVRHLITIYKEMFVILKKAKSSSAVWTLRMYNQTTQPSRGSERGKSIWSTRFHRKSMTHGAEYMRDPPSRGSDAAHPRRVLWRFSHGSGWTTPCLDWCRKNPSCPILISTPLCPHLHFPPPPLLGRPPPSAWTRPQQRQRTRARARAAGCGDGVSPYGRSRGTGRTWRLYAATAGRGGCTGSGCGRERAPERGRLDAAATAGCSGGGSPDGRTRGAGWTRRWMDTAGVTATAMAHPRLRFARHLRWKWEPTADAGRGRTAARIRAAGNGGGVGVSQGRPGSGAGPAKSWRAADFDNTGTSTASTAGFKTPSSRR
nr:uncharacterized protein LOC127292809 isoform X2 [Lolium perenne]XP_051178256.1 uncharacterized protein LOC127292809 isoform X2 [Lolium perenne]XP_051178257.1 uncharacterized protein LOC127292809 isoform X2 [Lolium perenne]XP_051178258.1 uncharacterized protein LOC127292809 isoform X2 [Lolium perenne]